MVDMAHAVLGGSMGDDDNDRIMERWDRQKGDCKYLIREVGNYVVFIDRDGDIDWATRGIDEHEGYNAKKHNALMSAAAVAETKLCEGFTPPMVLQFKRLVGEAVVYNFEAAYDSARQLIDAACAYHKARSEETSRSWYLSGCFRSVLPALVIGALVWIFRDNIESAFGENAVLFTECCVMGSLGALLSVIWRSGKLQFDCSAGKRLHDLESASRIAAGAISGLLVGAAVKYQIFLSLLAVDGRENGIMMLAALASGTSERFATSIISSMHTRTKEENSETDK
jgi:hypothetical protein